MSALAKEKWAASQIEGRYMKKERRYRIIACEELDFYWSEDEALEFERFWKQKRKERENQRKILEEFAERVERDPDEVLFLFVDRARKGRL